MIIMMHQPLRQVVVFVFYDETKGDFFGGVARFPGCDGDRFEIRDPADGVVGNAGVVAISLRRRGGSGRGQVLNLAAAALVVRRDTSNLVRGLVGTEENACWVVGSWD